LTNLTNQVADDENFVLQAKRESGGFFEVTVTDNAPAPHLLPPGQTFFLRTCRRRGK
jgi:hypothetical protein